MKFSVFVSESIYFVVEVDAEDHLDAAHKVALAAATDDTFLIRHPGAELDEVELEVVTVATQQQVDRDEISMEAYNAAIVTYDAETVNEWIGPFIHGYTLNPQALEILNEEDPET